MNKYIIYLFLFPILFSSTPVLAQTWYSSDIDSGYVMGATDPNTSDRKPLDTTVLRKSNFTDISELRDMKVDERKAAIDALKKQKFEDRCLNIQKNIDNRKNFYQNSYTKAISRYQGIVKGLNNMVARLDKVGVETTSIKAMIVNLENLVAQLNAKHDTMVANMVQTRALACDTEKQKEYRVSVQNTMNSLKEERQQIMDMRKYIQEQIVVELRKIKTDLEAKRDAQQELNSEDNTNE